MFLSAGRLVERIAADSGGLSSRYGPLLAAVVVALGILCWRRGRAIVSRWLWLAAFAFVTITQFAAVAYASLLVASGASRSAALMLLVAGLLVPAAYGLYQYSARSADIWQKDSISDVESR